MALPTVATRGAAESPLRILVVDDDPTMQQLIVSYLHDNDIETAQAHTRQDVLTLLQGPPFGLILLDLRLGRDDGLDLLREIRRDSDVPVIIITGHRRDEVDRVIGLELGADDYLTKPFGMREMLARIRAVIRRHGQIRTTPARETPAMNFRFAGWELERRVRRLRSPDGSATELTKGEFGLLVAFLEAPQRPLSREHLLQATRVHEDVFDRSIDVKILRLRRKLGDSTTEPGIIQTRRGLGYVFMLPVERF